MEEVLRVTGDREAYFWSTHSGVELDLLVYSRGKRFGFEFKYADAPRTTRSMVIALSDLKLQRIFVIAPGPLSYPIDDRIEVMSIRDVGGRLARVVGGAGHARS